MSPTTPLFYSTVGSITGIAVLLGRAAAFFPCEEEVVYITNVEHVQITAQVPPLLTSHLNAMIERRLRALREVR